MSLNAQNNTNTVSVGILKTSHAFHPKLIKWDKDVMWLSFWMAFQALLIIGQNVALFFILLILARYTFSLSNFRKFHWAMIFPVLIGFAALASVIFTPSGSYIRGLQVLPNYIYWQILLIALIGASRYINFEAVCKGLFWGVLILLIYYQFFYFGSIPYVLIRLSHNTIAFILICFTAPALIYCKKKYGLLRTLLFFAYIMFVLLALERRSGTVFTFLTGTAALVLPKVKPSHVLVSLLSLLCLAFLLNTSFFKNAMFQSSERLHELIYESEKTRTTDRSYLTRLLMIEKGKLIFEEYPITGVGLNNFTQYNVNFVGDFQGSKFVIDKKGMNETSAHNSYLGIIAEGGLLLIIPILCLILFNIVRFISRYNQHSIYQNGIYWGLIGALFAMYFVSGIYNVNTWYLIGLCTAISISSKKQNRR